MSSGVSNHWWWYPRSPGIRGGQAPSFSSIGGVGIYSTLRGLGDSADKPVQHHRRGHIGIRLAALGSMSVVLGWNRGRRWVVVWYGILLLYNNILVGHLIDYWGSCFSLKGFDMQKQPVLLVESVAAIIFRFQHCLGYRRVSWRQWIAVRHREITEGVWREEVGIDNLRVYSLPSCKIGSCHLLFNLVPVNICSSVYLTTVYVLSCRNPR